MARQCSALTPLPLLSPPPPQGLRANLLRLYNTVSEESFVQCKAVAKYQKLLFVLTYFHSVLLERRKFRTLGLNIPYDFNDTDFRCDTRRAARCVTLGAGLIEHALIWRCHVRLHRWRCILQPCSGVADADNQQPSPCTPVSPSALATHNSPAS